MSAYLLANITVNNPENYKEYVSKVKSVVEKFMGWMQSDEGMSVR